MQVHSQLILVCRAGQSQLIPVENRIDCRSGRFRLQAVTPSEQSPVATAHLRCHAHGGSPAGISIEA